MKAIAKHHFLKPLLLVMLFSISIFLEAQCLTDGSNRISHNPVGINGSPPGPSADGNLQNFGQSFSYSFSGTRQIQNIVLFSKGSDFGTISDGSPNLGTDVTITVNIYQGEGFGGALLYSSPQTVHWPAEGEGITNVDPSIHIPIDDGPLLNSSENYTFRVIWTAIAPSVGFNLNSNLYANGNFINFEETVFTNVDVSFEVDFSFPIETPTITESATTLTSSSASTYQWTKDDIDINGATAQTLDVSNQEGSYQVRITDSNGCEGISEPFTVDNKVPVFTSVNATTVQEGTTGIIYSASATDLSEPITYSLATGVNDNALFSITGANISFITPPVFNQGGNNTYTLTVTATDDATNSSDLDVTVTVFRPLVPPNGECGTVLNFEGAENEDNGYVQIPDAPALDLTSSFTVETYVKFDAIDRETDGYDWHCLFAKNSFNSSYGLMMLREPNPENVNSPARTLRFYHSGVTNAVTSVSQTDYDWTVSANRWYHLALTIGSNTASMYIDGVQVVSQTVSGTLNQNDLPLILGRSDSGPYPLEGSLDDFRVWDRALTTTEIQGNIDNGVSPTASGLIAYYDFNEGSGTIINDLAGTNNGTLINEAGAFWQDVNGNAVTNDQQSITGFSDINATFGNADFDLSAASDAGTEAQGFTITYESSDESVATVSGKTITIVAAGATTITATQTGGLIDGSCYAPASTSQVLTVNPAPLTISATDATIDYGDDIPASIISYSGFVNGDDEFSLMGTLTFIDPPTNAGATPYADGIVPSGFTSNDYSITYETGDLTIDPVPLTVTANDLIITYGETPIGSLSASYAGFVNGEDENTADLTGTLTFASITDTDARATPYEDVIIPSGLSSSNYDISYESANLTINQTILTVTANDQTITYGDDTELFSVSYSGFVNAEDENTSDITGSVTFDNLPTDASSSTYIDAIQPSGLTSNNYNIIYESGNLFIGRAPLAATVNQSITFGDNIPAPFTITYTGFVNGDDETVIDTPPITFASGLSAGSDAGIYNVLVILGSDNNYNISSTNGTLTIDQVPQTIMFSSLEEQNIVEGTTLELTATGGASGEPVIYSSSNTSVATVSGSTMTLLLAGVTTITANQAGNTNYEAATPVDQTLIVIEEYIWDGTSWNSGSTPPADVAIMIEADYTTSSHGTFEAANLEIAENITLTIDDQDAIVVNDDLIMDGDITLNSGGILALFGNTSGTGTVTTNRNVTPDLGYSMVGTTVGNVSVSVLSVSPDFLYGFDGTNFTIPTTLEAGKGYFVAYDAPNPLFTVTGTPTTGMVSVSLMYSDDGDATNDFNLISNPYNAAISRQDFVDNNTSIDGVTYYWQDGGSNLPSGSRSGNYVTVTANGTTTGGTFDGNIRSGQGFFVRATSSSTISFDPEDQVTDLTSNTDGGFFRTASTQMIRLTITNQTSEDEAVITFSENGTPSLDQGLDAYKFMNPGLSLYSLAGETALAIQALPEITEAVQIPLGYQTTASGEAQFSVDLSAFSSSEDIYLHDQLTGNKIDLRANPSPTFTLDDTQSQTRFVLEVSARLLSASQNLNPSLLVYGSKESLTVKAADLSGGHLVQIHSLEGKLLYNQRVIFESGQAQLSPKIRMNGLYLLQVGGKQTKFITRD